MLGPQELCQVKTLAWDHKETQRWSGKSSDFMKTGKNLKSLDLSKQKRVSEKRWRETRATSTVVRLWTGGSFSRDLGKKAPFSILTSEETEASVLRVIVLVGHRFTVKTVRCQVCEYSFCTTDGGRSALLYPKAWHRSGPGHFWWVQAFQDPRCCRADTCRDAGSGIPRSPTAETAR